MPDELPTDAATVEKLNKLIEILTNSIDSYMQYLNQWHSTAARVYKAHPTSLVALTAEGVLSTAFAKGQEVLINPGIKYMMENIIMEAKSSDGANVD